MGCPSLRALSFALVKAASLAVGAPAGFTIEIDARYARSQAALIDPVVDVDLQRPAQLGRRHGVAEYERHVVVDANLQWLAARLIAGKASRKLRAQQLEYGAVASRVLRETPPSTAS